MRRRALSASGSLTQAPTEPLPAPPAEESIDLRLIRRVQVYLEARRIGLTPGPDLDRAWLAFFEAADPVVRAAARSSLKDLDEQADGIQEAWREILATLPAYRHDPARGRPRDWLFILARRACIRLGRRLGGALEPLPPGAEDRLEGREAYPWSGRQRGHSWILPRSWQSGNYGLRMPRPLRASANYWSRQRGHS
jgi:hypothetical protein